MGAREDDDNAYRTDDDMVGRSIRRGTRKALKALTFGLLGGDPISSLGADAAKEFPEMVRRSRERDDE